MANFASEFNWRHCCCCCCRFITRRRRRKISRNFWLIEQKEKAVSSHNFLNSYVSGPSLRRHQCSTTSRLLGLRIPYYSVGVIQSMFINPSLFSFSFDSISGVNWWYMEFSCLSFLKTFPPSFFFRFLNVLDSCLNSFWLFLSGIEFRFLAC